jgi:hypothetical protein
MSHCIPWLICSKLAAVWPAASCTQAFNVAPSISVHWGKRQIDDMPPQSVLPLAGQLHMPQPAATPCCSDSLCPHQYYNPCLVVRRQLLCTACAAPGTSSSPTSVPTLCVFALTQLCTALLHFVCNLSILQPFSHQHKLRLAICIAGC